MSTPPPGYNPAESVFKGGESVSIAPMAGGGSIQPPIGYNPAVSVFKGGDEVSIAGVEGGGLEHSDVQDGGQGLVIPAVQSQVLSQLSMGMQSGPAAAAAAASAAVLKQTGNLQLAKSAGAFAAFTQGIKQITNNAASQVDLSPDDAAILRSVKSGSVEEREARAVALQAYNQNLAQTNDIVLATQAAADASVAKIKAYRISKGRPVNPGKIDASFDISSIEAQGILATTDPSEIKIGKAAYDAAIAANGNTEEGKRFAIIAQVQAIKNSRISAKGIHPENMTHEEEEALINTTDPVEIAVGQIAREKAIKQAKETKSSLNLKSVGDEAAAQSIKNSRNSKGSLRAPRLFPDPTAPLTKEIKKVNSLPVYLEYIPVENALDKTYMEFLQQRKAEVSSRSFDERLKNLMKTYQASQEALWRKGTLNEPTLPRVNSVKSVKSGEILNTFSRLTYILPNSTKDVFILPPMNGNLDAFIKALQTLKSLDVIESDLRIKENNVIVCTPPFYSLKLEPIDMITNTILFSIVLDITNLNSGQMFVLTQHAAEDYFVGKMFHGRRGVTTNEPILNMLEPSYILYPYPRMGIKGIVISSAAHGASAFPTDSTGKITIANILDSKQYGNSRVRTFKPNLKVEGATEYFHIRGSLDVTNIPNINLGSCGLANYLLTDSPSMKISVSHTSDNVGVILAIRLQDAGSPYLPLCTSSHLQQKDMGEKFTGSSAAHTNPKEVQTAFFEIAGSSLQIRRSNKRDIVYNDWSNGVYSDDEAALLNLIHLKPKIMDKIFPPAFDNSGNSVGIPWKEWVANFLSTITINKSLKTHRETLIVRNFLEQVRTYFLNHAMKRDLGESDSDDETTRKKYGLLEPDDVKDIHMETFEKIKDRWGTLDIKEHVETQNWVASIILVNKTTYKQLYRTIGVPMAQYSFSKARPALEEKLTKLKNKFPNWIIIY